jgi:hypothetical protein
MKRQDTDRPSLQSILGFFSLIILAIALAFIPLPGYPGGPMPDYPTRAESDADLSGKMDTDGTNAAAAVSMPTTTLSVATMTTRLLNCTATGTFTIPLVAPDSPLPGMIWFEEGD